MKNLLNTSNKLKLEKFFKDELWQLLIVVAFIFMISWLFDKPYEGIMFSIAHVVLRPIYKKQYHCEFTYYCLFTTFSIVTFGIYNCLPTTISLLSSLPIASLICWVGYVVQDRIDLINKLKPNLKTITLEEFENICKLNNLTIDEVKIAKYIIRDELKGDNLHRTIGYSKRQTIRIRKKIYTKLKYGTNMTP
jgi:hypothetical protein